MPTANQYVINLDRRPDRLAAVAAELAGAGLGFDRIDAVDAKSCDPAELDISVLSGPIGDLTPGARACTASHFRALTQFLASRHDFAVIFEDDIMIDPVLGALLADLSWIRADLVKIEKFSAHKVSKLLLGENLGPVPGGRTLRPMLSRHTGAAGYIISRRGAEAALAQAGTINVPIDHFLFNATVSTFARRIRPAMLVQPVVWQSEEQGGASDIAARPMPISHLRKLRRSLVRAIYEARFWPAQIAALITGRGQLVRVEVPRR